VMTRRTPRGYDPREDPYALGYETAPLTVVPPTVTVGGEPPRDPRLAPNTATDRVDPRVADPPTSNPWTDPRTAWNTEGGWEGESQPDRYRRNRTTASRDPEDERTRLVVDPPGTTPTPPPVTTTAFDYATAALPVGDIPETGWDAGKWGNERSVKYVAAAILNRYKDANGFIDIPAAMQDPDWKQWFPKATFVEGGAHDSIDFGDVLSDFTKGTPVGIVDVGFAFDPTNKTGRGLTWLPRNATGTTKPVTTASPGTTTPTPPVAVRPPVDYAVPRPRPDVVNGAADIDPEAYRRLAPPINDLMTWRRTRQRVV
jgi:hypothetical protein